MRISRVEPDDEETFARFVAVSRAAVLHGDGHDTPYTADELAGQLRNLDPGERVAAYVGVVDGTVVAAGMTQASELDNTDKVYLEVWIEPRWRRRGYGSAVVTDLLARAVEEGRTTAIAHVDYPMAADETHPYRAFATASGFTLANAEVHRVLALPVAATRLDELLAETAPHHHDYTFAEFEGALPVDIMPAYCELLNALITDAPSGALEYERGGATPADFAARLDSLAAQGRRLYSSVAFDTDGVPVAHSELVVPASDLGRIFQWSTFVRAGHRGHRLGLATKLRNLREVQGLHPDRVALHTWNAESNSYMVAVNEQMGFVPVGYNSAYHRSL